MFEINKQDIEELGENAEIYDFISVDSSLDLDDTEALSRKFSDFPFKEKETPVARTFPNVVMICGIPIVKNDKLQKLRTAITKRISKELIERNIVSSHKLNANDTSNLFSIDFPTTTENGEPETTGVCFVTFADAYIANKAASCLSRTGLDAKHPFTACCIDDFDDIVNQQFLNDKKIEIGFSRHGFRDWLQDALGREQYICRCASVSQILWHDPIEREAQIVFAPQDALGQAVCWSTLGSYLVTFHSRGIWLRADNNFTKKISFNHRGVRYILFSPNEEYIVTWDGSKAHPENDQAVIVWNVFTGNKLRSFMTPTYSPSGSLTDIDPAWPFYLFSHDSKYLALRREKDILIYETSNLDILEDPNTNEKTPLGYTAEQFQWSPVENIMSIWITEHNDSPGRLVLVHIPSRQELSSKNVFSVKHVSMHWHPRGEFLALCTIIARKKGKKSKQEITQIEIFRVKEKNVPVETITLDHARIQNFYWEAGQSASRFALLVSNESSLNQCIQFYNVPSRSVNQDTELVEVLDIPSNINYFEWSPSGHYFIAASKGSDGTLLFCCLNENNKVEIIQKDEQFDLTDVAWDPSGRYVATSVLITSNINSYRLASSAGFRIYSFLGKLQRRFTNESCCQFLWRPRPTTLLSKAKIDDVYKKMKDYSKKYDALDESRRQVRNALQKMENSEKVNLFREKCNAAETWFKSHPLHASWEESWVKFKENMEFYEKRITTSEVIDVVKEFVKKNTE